MYVNFLLGLGGWVAGAPDDEEAEASAEAASPDAELPKPAWEPRPGCFSARPAHRCCWRRASGVRT